MRGDISILVPAVFSEIVAILTAPAVYVLDLVSQICDVVLVRRTFSSGKPQGVRILEWGVYEPGEGNGEVSLRATWERGGRILSQQGGFQVSGGWKTGEQRGAKGSKEKYALYIIMLVVYIYGMLVVIE